MAEQRSESWFGKLAEEYSTAIVEAANSFCTGVPDNDTGLNTAEALRQIFRIGSVGQMLFLEANPTYPTLIKQQTVTRQVVLPSADAIYITAAIDGRYRYRLHGPRGSAHIIQVATYSGSSHDLQNFRPVSAGDNFTRPDWKPDSEFDLLLGADQSEGPGLLLPEGPCELNIRQYFADWETERPACLVLERVDAEYPPPAPTREEITEGTRKAIRFFSAMAGFIRKNIEQHLEADPHCLTAVNVPEAFKGVVYLFGHYRCERDQAVILEVRPPESNYWSFQLSNVGAWEGLDYHLRQCSLNMAQAKLDSDGVFRAVISQQDPGVPNWLDSTDRSLGLISGRYFQAESTPEVTLKTVPLDEVRSYLPRDTAVVSSDQRQQQLKQRLYSVYARGMAE